MAKHINIHQTFKALTLLLVCTLLSTTCAKNPLNEPYVGEKGKQVKVNLSFSVTSLAAPSGARSSSHSKGAERAHGKLNIDIAKSHPDTDTRTEVATRATERASLYNLWVMQFGTDKRLVKATKIPNTPEPIKEMITIDADLIVGTKQTLYLVCLGYQHDIVDLSTIKDIDELERFQIPTISYVDGIAQSIINEQRDIPYLGFCEGVDIVQIENDGRGYVKYNSESGFVGGIPMRAMISKITFNFSYMVDKLTPELMVLNNVPTSFCINPSADYKPSSFVSLPATIFSADEFASGKRHETVWYVAPNTQGDVPTITTQEDRYFYYQSDGAKGSAPSDGTYINISVLDSEVKDRYALYYIFLGSNTTSDFNVHPHTHYILRSDINTAPSDNDNRVIFSTLKQKIDFNVSKFSELINHYNVRYGTKYDLDAAPGRRPIEVTSLRGRIKVEVLKDANATSPLPESESWIQLSSSSNYTDALNRKKNGDQNALTTALTVQTDIPSLTKLYLYHDENLDYTTFEPFKAPVRSLAIRFTFSSETQPSESYTYIMDQRCAFYVGQVGGDQDASTGVYSKGLVIGNKFNLSIDDFLSYNIPSPPADQFSILKIGVYPDVIDYQQLTTKFGVDNRVNGKQATKLYSENRDGYQRISTSGVAITIPAPSRSDGKLDLYQYQGKYNSGGGFAARWCYDKNRDKNGNGKIDDLPNDPANNELIWYLPAINQIRHFGLSFFGTDYYDEVQSVFAHFLVSSSFHSINNSYWPRPYSPVSSALVSYEAANEVRCVRDVDLPVTIKHAKQSAFGTARVEVVDNYAVINTTALAAGAYVDKTKSGNEHIDADGRNVRHLEHGHKSKTLSIAVSARFRVAPLNIQSDGSEINITSNLAANKMTWAEASGFNTASNTIAVGVDGVHAVDTGCAVYNGRSIDPSLGKWRLPTLNEMALIEMLESQLLSTSTITGYAPLAFNTSFLIDTPGTSSYWTATEYSTASTSTARGQQAWGIREQYKEKEVVSKIYLDYKRAPANLVKSTRNYVRCVQDIPLP